MIEESGNAWSPDETLFSLPSLHTILPFDRPEHGGGIHRSCYRVRRPDFKAHNLVTGEKIPLSDQRGKVVIVTFWATWCAPCRRELPYLETAQKVVGRDKLTVFVVNFKENPEATAALRELASTWQINVVDDRNGWIASRYAISSIPHLFIIDRDGKILANHIGYGDHSVDELIADINHAFAEPPPGQGVSPPGTDPT